MTARHTTLWTFVITSVALFMVTLDNLVVTTAIPVLRTDLGASLESLEWTVNAYTLTFAVLLMTGAALGDTSAAGSSSRSGSASSRSPPQQRRSHRPSRRSTSPAPSRGSAARS